MSAARPSWRLNARHAAITQGLVVSGFGHLPTGRALFLEFSWSPEQRRGWLDTLAMVAPITAADGKADRAAAIAFSFTGLRAMDAPAALLDSFADPFREGMMQEDRLRRLHDKRKGEWLATVIPGGPIWSANVPQRGPMQTIDLMVDRSPTSTGRTEQQVTTDHTVHALLLLYERDEAAADAWAEAVKVALAPHGVGIVRRLSLELRPDPANDKISREHFGFADGVSQPIPYDADPADQAETVVYDDGRPAPADRWNGVPLGEILFGHENGHNERAPGPVAPDLPDFGLDGSYLVVRELKQDVAAFWQSMKRGAEALRALDPSSPDKVDADWLAARAIGRDRDGNLLCPAGPLPIGADGGPDNDFGFFDTDPAGHGCPVGSHVRRGNPRDGLAVRPGQKASLLAAANNHRLLRRGRKYGPPIADPYTDDGEKRGLLFMALNTDIGRQFEFVQQTWMMNANFATLYDETDPLLGPPGPMTVRAAGRLRRVVPVETFVQLVGGDYFFLPSLDALAWLARP